jgi:hypothetical protein
MQSPVNPPIGEIDIVTIANPAAGANFVYLTPNAYLYWLKSVHFTLTTDATVLARHVNVNSAIGAAIFWETEWRNWQAASTTFRYCAYPATIDFLAAASVLQVAALPTKHIITANTIINSVILNLAAADQISDITLTFEKWVLQTV